MKSSRGQKARSQDYESSNNQGRLRQGWTADKPREKSSQQSVYEDSIGDQHDSNITTVDDQENSCHPFLTNVISWLNGEFDGYASVLSESICVKAKTKLLNINNKLLYDSLIFRLENANIINNDSINMKRSREVQELPTTTTTTTHSRINKYKLPPFGKFSRVSRYK